jgi:sugar phosphate isomerase/epimerase
VTRRISVPRAAVALASAVFSVVTVFGVDAYHVWWDPNLYEEVERAAGRILGYHVSDWLVPTPELIAGRGIMGDGVIQLRAIRAAVEQSGYDGPIEVEVINRSLWELPGDEALDRVVRGFLNSV